MRKRTNTRKASRNRKNRRKISINALLWIIVIFGILFYTVGHFNTLHSTITKLFKNKKSEEKLFQKSQTDKTKKFGVDNLYEKNDDISVDSKHDSLQKNDLDRRFDEDKNDGASSSAIANKTQNNVHDEKNAYAVYLYFVLVTDEGSFILQKQTRHIKETQTVLTRTLRILLQGPDVNEKSRGIQSFIPTGSILQSVSITNNIAFVNMNDAFQFNPLGKIATEAQIYQVVYTCTEFPTINSVQFLINGEIVSYLSGEGGTFTGKPISRNSLASISIQ